MGQMNTPAAILDKALKAPAKSSLEEHLSTIRTLRRKKYSWREVADFLTEHGVPTDHSKVFRVAQKYPEKWEVPGADAYYDALVSLDAKGKLNASAWAMVQFHFWAHNRTVTYTQLAQAAATAQGKQLTGTRPHVTANAVYGKLGRILGQEVGMEFLPSIDRDEPFYSSAIGIGNSATPDRAEFELVMHHELAKALERLRSEGKLATWPTDATTTP